MPSPGNTPLLRISIPLIGGISTGQYVSEAGLANWVSGLWILVFILFSLLIFKALPLPSYRVRWYAGILVVLLFAATGCLLNCLRIPVEFSDTQREFPLVNDISTVIGVVIREPEAKEKSVALAVQAFGLKSQDAMHVMDCRIMVYVPKGSDSLLNCFDTIAVRGKLHRITNPGNPDEFDYASYMQRKGFLYRMFVRDGGFVILSCGNPDPLTRYIISTRQHIKARIFASSLNPKNKGLAVAMLLGDKAFLDEEVREGFSIAGTIHILCVSGLHAGIIFLLVSTFLGWLRRFGKPGRLAFVLISATAIWAYAALTGFTPSVNRASLMMTLILMGNLLNRKVDTLNNVAGAALLLLVYDPGLLKDMGFQLSFLAVAGIVLLFKPLSGIWAPGNKILRYIRDMVGVSLSAQLFTLPVTMAAFGSFPVWFLPANLLVLPLTGITMYAGVAFTLAPNGISSMGTGWVFDFLLSTIRTEVDVISTLPMARIEGIFISDLEKALLMGSVICLAVWLNSGGRKFLHLLLMLLLMLLLSSAIKIHKRSGHKEIVVYHLTGQTLVDFSRGTSRQTVWLGKQYDEGKAGYASGGYRTRTGTFRSHSRHRMFQGEAGEVCHFSHPAGKLMVLEALPEYNSAPDTVDVAIIRGAMKPTAKVFSRVNASQWVLDGSVNEYRIKRWKEEAESTGIDFWITAEKGALILEAP